MWDNLFELASGLFYVSLALFTLVTVFVAVGLSQGLFRQTVSSWSWRHILSLTNMTTLDKRFLASMEAEELVEQILLEEGWKHVFLRRRVFVPRLGHNREIDVVAVGPVILVVEVKHWQGQIWSNGPRWFQHPAKDKRAVEFEDIQEDNLVKATALRRFIENDQRIALPDHETCNTSLSEQKVNGRSQESGTWYTDRRVHKQCGDCIVPIIVFTHPSAVLDPNTIKQKKGVFDLPSFRTYARQVLHDRDPNIQPFSSFWGRIKQLVRSLLLFSSNAALSSELQKRIAASVDGIRTWDMLYLHNGRLAHGDITEIHFPTSLCFFERKHVKDLKVMWFHGLSGFVRGIWEGSAALVRVQLGTAKRVSMRRDEVTFPILKRNLRHMSMNDRVVLKLAGTGHLEIIPLADIREVRLSHHLQN